MFVEITKDNYEEIVLKSDKPVVLDFYAEWCGPCKNLLPILEHLALDYSKNIVFGKVNVDLEQEITENYRVKNIPCVIFLNEGETIQRKIGSDSKEAYENALRVLI
jgi:thioredoxin 1